MENKQQNPESNPAGNPAGGRDCAVCGYQNPAKTQTCLNCGSALETGCPVCGQAVPGHYKFCSRCGAAMPASPLPETALQRAGQVQQNLRALMPTALAQKISAAAGEILGEYREVAVLYVNVMNASFTPDTPDNENTYLLMDEALRLLVEVVYRYEGAVDKFTGDGLVALFGAPVAHENDTERAVRAALEMQTVIRPWQEQVKQTHGFDFRVRMGINTGPVIAGKVGNDLHMEYTVIGETVTLAYHLQLAAEPGAILVSKEIYQQTRPLVEYRALPPLTMKWLPQPIRAFQARHLRDKPAWLDDRLRLHVPMIGRAHNMGQLHQALQAVQQYGQNRVAVVSGEAGIGKSRLVAEFRRAVDTGKVGVYQGNCLTYARQKPLWVVAELVRDLIHLPENGPEADRVAAFRAYLEQQNLARPEVLPYLAHLLGLPQDGPELESRLQSLDPAMLQRQTHAALRQLFLAKAQQQPTVLIFEDLQWVDQASRDFMEYLIQTTADAPLLLVLVTRDLEPGTGLQSLASLAEAEPERWVDVPVRALSPSEGQLLADHLIPQTTAQAWGLKQQIVTRAQGNPFFIEELIRALIDQNGLVRTSDGGGWQVTLQATELLKTVPGTVKGLILARFDRLPESMRNLLQKAAVLGATFPVSLLQSLANTSTGTLAFQLDRLEAQQFLKPVQFRSRPGYIFQHALLQETIYSTLLKRDRARIHTRAAEAIEQSDFWLPEEQAEVLAYHYVQSSRPDKAIPHLLVAADNAARRCVYDTAIAHYRQAIRLLAARSVEPDRQFFQARLGLGRSLKFVGEFDAAAQILTEALQSLWRWEQAQDPAAITPILVEGLRQVADIRQREGRYDAAWQYLEAGLQLVGQAESPEQVSLRRALLDRMAWIRFRQSKLQEAWTLANEAVSGLKTDTTADPARLASLLNTLGGICWHQGKLDEAIGYVERSLSLYESMGYLWGTAIAYGNLGILYEVLGNWLKAAEYYNRAYAVQQLIGNPEGQALSLENLGLLHMVMGEHRLSRQELEDSLSIRRRLGDAWGAAQCHINLAQLALIQERLDDALAQANSAREASQKIESAEIQVQLQWVQARIRADSGELETGLNAAEQALEMARSVGLVEKEIDCLRGLGALRARAGQHTEAENLLLASVNLAIKQNDPYRRGLALFELGRLYRQMAQTNRAEQSKWQTKAQATLKSAARLFETLGAAYDLRLVQSLAAAAG